MIDSSPLTVRLFYCFNIRGTYHPNSKYCWETLHCTSLSQFPLSGKVETPGLKLFFSRIFSSKKMASKFWAWISSIRIAFFWIIIRKLVLPGSEKWKLLFVAKRVPCHHTYLLLSLYFDLLLKIIWSTRFLGVAVRPLESPSGGDHSEAKGQPKYKKLKVLG